MDAPSSGAGAARSWSTPPISTFCDTPEFLNSPVVIVQRTARELRYRMDDPDSHRFPFFDDMRNEGVTDYLALPLVYTDGTVHVASWTTKEPGGFTDEQLAALRKVVLPFSRVGEIMAMRRTAATLLDTYVGNRAGERIWAGQIRRGHAEEMQAAIWLSDLRGFTALSDRLPAATVVDILNQYFDCQVPVIRKHGGEILKFMGDGLLAVFPIAGDGGNLGEVCRACLEAGREARANVDAMRYPNGEGGERFRFGVALHIGAILFGNIGGMSRLDFTCIGPAVNLAARLEKIASKPASHGGGVRGVRRRMSQRLDRSRRVSDRGLLEGAAGVRLARRGVTRCRRLIAARASCSSLRPRSPGAPRRSSRGCFTSTRGPSCSGAVCSAAASSRCF